MNKVFVFCLITFFISMHLIAQNEYSNRYSMKLEKMSDGRFTLINKDRYAAIVNIDTISDLLVPYYHKDKNINASEYEEVKSAEFVYKSHPDYDLKLIVDYALSDKPAPFMVYIHGGGWARGDFSSNSDISKYCAKHAGITGIRINYTLSGKPNATIDITIEDVKDAVDWVRRNHKMLGINPNVFGFMGSSAGAHLSAVAAMSVPGSKVLIGVSGIYDLISASISMNATDSQRIKYFNYKDKKTLTTASPLYLIPENNIPACYLVHGTADIVVECIQTVIFSNALKDKGIKRLKVELYPLYDHNIGSKKSDLKEHLFFESFNFIKSNLK